MIIILDKNVEYKHVIMCLRNEKYNPHKEIKLPKGYSFSFYKEGFEKDWAKTELEVLEFETYEKALNYFMKDMLPFKEELSKRMVFIMNEHNVPVANACAWYKDYKGVHQAHIHYIAVRPEYQNLGLGKAIFLKVMSLFNEFENGEDIYLHTQTWSHKAIGMYLRYGFEIIKDDRLNYYEIHRQEALNVLQKFIPNNLLNIDCKNCK